MDYRLKKGSINEPMRSAIRITGRLNRRIKLRTDGWALPANQPSGILKFRPSPSECSWKENVRDPSIKVPKPLRNPYTPLGAPHPPLQFYYLQCLAFILSFDSIMRSPGRVFRKTGAVGHYLQNMGAT
jgi:hypothetical protein